MTDTDEPKRTRRPGTLPVRLKSKDEKPSRALARAAVAPDLNATLALHAIHKKAGGLYADLDVGDLADELGRAARDETATGTDRLMTQAVVLDKLFAHLTGVAMRQEYVSSIAPALNLALRAQAQCRATLQAVSDICHPRQYVGTQHVDEQYNAGGHQQVNRAGQAERPPRPPTAPRTGARAQIRRPNCQKTEAMSYTRTEAHRQASRERALHTRPWEHSTGPRTADGKAASAGNRYRGATRSKFRGLARALREQARYVREVRA